MLNEKFDAVVMLTWSDWYTEMRSNRYHYASRFSRMLPVIFVQPDLNSLRYSFEDTELSGVTVLHVYRHFGSTQTGILARALNSRKILKPLVWTYNYLFDDFIVKCHAPLKVYHATEDYFSPDFADPSSADTLPRLKKVLQNTDLLISISAGIHEDYTIKGGYTGKSAVITNGCDYRFWTGGAEGTMSPAPENTAKIALYEGGISRKIDFDLMKKLAEGLPDWEFRLCGRLFLSPEELPGWQDLLSSRNVRYLGTLPVDELKKQMHEATAGLIPFVRNDWISERSFPLKTFEYLACGLPVVSVPIKSIEPYACLVKTAPGPDEFIAAVAGCPDSRYDLKAVAERKEAARAQDYDTKFTEAVAAIDACFLPGAPDESLLTDSRLNILVLYDDGSTHVSTIREHLESFATYSRHHVFYASATREATCSLDLSIFDAVVLHYSIRVSLTSHLSSSYAEQLKGYPGLKVLFIQDEYDSTCTAWDWIHSLGIHVVYTCVPPEYLDYVYPGDRFRQVGFVNNLTGFVPIRFEQETPTKPLKERPYLLGYRGRKLPFWYGTLGYEKYIIGVRMRQICLARGLPADIECDDSKRIYGEKWYEFIEDCRAVLGTESGSNVFDFHGTIQRDIEDALKANPRIGFEEIHERFLKDHEANVCMNQISPKIFEAIALKTALVLFEGQYSGIVRPGVHYIPLKKDFSNVDEVLEKLQDLDYLDQLTSRAYEDVIRSGRYSYRSFIESFDADVSLRRPRGQGKRLISSISAWKDADGEVVHQMGPGFGNEKGMGPSDVLLSRSTVVSRNQSRLTDYYLMASDLLPARFKEILFPILRPLKKWLL